MIIKHNIIIINKSTSRRKKEMIEGTDNWKNGLAVEISPSEIRVII